MNDITTTSWDLLDCTLRDGGYYTKWDFEPEFIAQYIDGMCASGVAYIEVGYRTPPEGQAVYQGEYFFLTQPTLSRLADLLEEGKAKHGHAPKVAIMLDAKRCTPEIVPCLLAGCSDIVSVVRMAVAPTKLDHALDLARAIKREGYDVAMNLMYISRHFEDRGLVDSLVASRDVVDVVNLVDSYGSCLPSKIGSCMKMWREAFPRGCGILLGYHGHNNISLALANALAAIENGAELIDATVTGMGRGAGNLQTELALVHRGFRDWSIMGPVVEALEKMRQVCGWGVQLPYMLSGHADIPQADVMSLLSRKRFKHSVIMHVLDGEEQVSRVTYPKMADVKSLTQNFKGAIIVGGGRTAIHHAASVYHFAKTNKLAIIHSCLKTSRSYRANAGGEDVTQILCISCQKPQVEQYSPEDHTSISYAAVCTSPRIASRIPDDLQSCLREVEPVTYTDEPHMLVRDTPFGLALGVVCVLEVPTLYLVGFDGYTMATKAQLEIMKEARDLCTSFQRSYPSVSVHSLTPTHLDIPTRGLYSSTLSQSL